MDRVLVAGSTGAGKTTMARTMAARFGLPHYELDALHHGPGWVTRPEFKADVERFSAEPRWVAEDQYHRKIGDLLWRRADTVLWLDHPRHTVMTRVVWRSVSRLITRQELYNGNREEFSGLFSADHPIWWAWSQYDRKRATVREYAARHPHVRLIRMTGRSVSVAG
jgi:adenylate kinase family enzyme